MLYIHINVGLHLLLNIAWPPCRLAHRMIQWNLEGKVCSRRLATDCFNNSSPVVNLHGDERDELVPFDLGELASDHVRHLVQISHLLTPERKPLAPLSFRRTTVVSSRDLLERVTRIG